MRTIVVINQKGGVGKTTTVVNLGAALAARGNDVCLIDMDPQSHLTLHLGIEPGTPDVSMYDVLTADAQLSSAIVKIAANLWLAPAVIDMAAAEIELAGTIGREQILLDRLAAHQRGYDFVMIDCPPSLGLLTLNALAAAEEVFIPLQPHFLALQGLGKLLETVSLVQRRINPKLRVSGVILCMYDSTTRLAAEVLADLQAFFARARLAPSPWAQTRIFTTVVRRNVTLAEAPSHGRTIFDYAPNSHGAEDYNALAEEILACDQPPAETDQPQDTTQPAEQPPAPLPAGELPAETLDQSLGRQGQTGQDL